MPAGEFELIERFFTRRGAQREDVLAGVGDDGALVDAPASGTLVFALDTLVEGTHFPAGFDARFVGHRALAVNLSDLAAMGAEPAWALLGLTLPPADENWLAGFSAGLDTLARRHGVAIVGGDTTRGPLTVSVALAGLVPAGQALLREGCAPRRRPVGERDAGRCGGGTRHPAGPPVRAGAGARCAARPLPAAAGARRARGRAARHCDRLHRHIGRTCG